MPRGSRLKDEVRRMSLFARSCLAVAAFCTRTSFVRDNIEDLIQLADIRAKGIVEGTIVRVDGIEVARVVVLIY